LARSSIRSCPGFPYTGVPMLTGFNGAIDTTLNGTVWSSLSSSTEDRDEALTLVYAVSPRSIGGVYICQRWWRGRPAAGHS